MLRKFKTFFPTILLLNIAVCIVELGSVFIRMQLINDIAAAQNSAALSSIVLVVTLILIENLLLIIEQAVEIRIRKSYKYHADEVIADKCSTLPLAIIEQASTREILYKARELFQKSIDRAYFICKIISLVLTLLALCALLLRTQPAMILCFLFLLSIAFYFNIRTSKVTFGFWSKYMSNARRYNYFSDIQTKREYAYERRIYHTSQAMDCRFSQAFDEAWHANRKNGLLRFRGQAVVEGIAISISIFTMFYFARPEALLTFSIGVYAAITDLVSRLLNAASECPGSIFSLREFNALKQELDEFLKLEPSEYRTSPLKSGDCSNLGDELVVFNNVSFSYPASNNLRVISNFTYSFKRGLHYGLVGVNGAGKTTIAKLILQLYAPTEGTIISVETSKTAIFQDFQIYPITVREYLLMGNDPSIEDEVLLDILSRFGCTPLKDGLDTPLSLLTEDGTLLSKGQFQRLAIARACLSNAEVIILDEPTASLDPISERQIYEICMDILKDRTCIFISHRLGAVRNMDEILVVDNGVLCEAGSHEKLMQLNGIYSKLYSTQREMYIDE